ncbi:calcium-transporting ATPase 12, plasma membrane-type-like [Pistacia vera]|uniref:calcium-transporting ATPase 12, plasma membrane-type-like n=1 Tax=Pistacia vera TaxID=55513 RepID=UPI001263ADDF|nr:calcium-transporting ATPase 12, plasma membrane-type-like [Pistacia vera]
MVLPNGLECALASVLQGTNPSTNGISGNNQDISRRSQSQLPAKGFLRFIMEAFKDATVVCLFVWSAASLGFGIKKHGLEDGWYEGGSIFIALLLIVTVFALSNFIIGAESNERTPLQARVDKRSSCIGRVGLSAAFLVLLHLLVHFFTGKTKDHENGSKTDFDDVLRSIACLAKASVAVWLAASPKGIPLVVNLTLAHTMKQMMGDKAIVRKLSAYETTGSATVICTDERGILTSRQMKVTKFWLDQESIEEEFCNKIPSTLRELLHQQAVLNTTGGPTEEAIRLWAVKELSMNLEEVMQKFTAVETFIAEKGKSAVSVRKNADNTVHVHCKGDAEMILAMCSRYYRKDGIINAMDENEKRKMKNVIDSMATSRLRCIAFAHKQIRDGTTLTKEDDLTLLGIIVLKDPCPPGIRAAVESCRSAEVGIKMITEDNVFLAKAIATDCGVLQLRAEAESDEVVEGIQFCDYKDEERMQKVDKIRVLARATPADKLLMVKCLKDKNHVVAVTGNGTDDANALKEAHTGFLMGNCRSEDAKESSDIIILDNNFTTVVTVLRWGRCVYNNIQKFIQFQLTLNVAALVIDFVAVLVARDAVPLTVSQLVWANLIMGALMALALATERPTDELMKTPPRGCTEPLITNVVWRNLLSQALYQILILLSLQFAGKSIFKMSPQVKGTMIFNTFCLCQLLNAFNARKLEGKNVFIGIHKNCFFLGILGITILLQFLMVELLIKKDASTEGLNWSQWLTSFVLAAFTLPIGLIVKFIPVREKPVLFVNPHGELDLGFIKGIKLLFCLLNWFFPIDCNN